MHLWKILPMPFNFAFLKTSWWNCKSLQAHKLSCVAKTQTHGKKVLMSLKDECSKMRTCYILAYVYVSLQLNKLHFSFMFFWYMWWNIIFSRVAVPQFWSIIKLLCPIFSTFQASFKKWPQSFFSLYDRVWQSFSANSTVNGLPKSKNG